MHVFLLIMCGACPSILKNYAKFGTALKDNSRYSRFSNSPTGHHHHHSSPITVVRHQSSSPHQRTYTDLQQLHCIRTEDIKTDPGVLFLSSICVSLVGSNAYFRLELDWTNHTRERRGERHTKQKVAYRIPCHRLAQCRLELSM